jgi:hypothetical protein
MAGSCGCVFAGCVFTATDAADSCAHKVDNRRQLAKSDKTSSLAGSIFNSQIPFQLIVKIHHTELSSRTPRFYHYRTNLADDTLP